MTSVKVRHVSYVCIKLPIRRLTDVHYHTL